MFLAIFFNLLFLSLSLFDSQDFSLSNSLKMSLSLREKDQIVYPGKTTCTFTVTYLLFCRSEGKKNIKN